jgi:hypothetical protein
MAKFVNLIWVFREADSFCNEGWTGFRARRFFCLSGKSLTNKTPRYAARNDKSGPFFVDHVEQCLPYDCKPAPLARKPHVAILAPLRHVDRL